MVLSKIKIRIIVLLSLIFFLSSCSDVGYRVEGNKVIYERPWNTARGKSVSELKADPKTFEILGDSKRLWAKDKSHVFIGGMKLEFLNPKTFIVINGLYAKDDKTVVCDYQPIKEADVSTFRVKEFQDESDKKIILGVDKNAVYECGESGYVRLVSDSLNDFRPIKDGFYHDKTKVWWHSIVLEKAIASRFRVIGGGYATDGIHVYYRGREVNGADAPSFKVTSDHYAKDKNHKYEMADRVEK